MANLITELNGSKAYIGLLTPEEINEANKFLEYLQDIIPKKEKELSKKYPSEKGKIYFAHEFGTELRKLVQENNVQGYQKRIFWDQIRQFASDSKNVPTDRSKQRYVYEYYYKLAGYSLEDVQNINWSEWSQIFDMPSLIQEDRFIDWIIYKSKQEKIKREELRELLAGVRIYIKDKELAMFNDNQLYERLDLVYEISLNRLILFDTYFTQQNKSLTEARRKKPSKYKQKYYESVFYEMKFNKEKKVYSICDLVFKKVYCVEEK